MGIVREISWRMGWRLGKLWIGGKGGNSFAYFGNGMNEGEGHVIQKGLTEERCIKEPFTTDMGKDQGTTKGW